MVKSQILDLGVIRRGSRDHVARPELRRRGSLLGRRDYPLDDTGSCSLVTGRSRAVTKHCRPTNLCGAMMAKNYSKHQQKIIKNYYDNREAISLQRLSELVTELYIAEGKGRERQWKYIVSALEKLEVPSTRIQHLREKDSPELLAQLVQELMGKT